MTQLFLLILAFHTFWFVAAAFYYENVASKFVAITFLAILSSAVYFSLDGVKGWPAEEPKDVRGTLASVVIVNPTGEDKGGIYISLFPTMEPNWYDYVYPRKAPKTYYLQYSNDRAAKFELAKNAMEEGKEVRINGIPPLEGNGRGNENAQSEAADGVVDGLMDTVKRLLPKQRDTYRPELPDVEILAPVIPPDKGTQQ